MRPLSARWQLPVGQVATSPLADAQTWIPATDLPPTSAIEHVVESGGDFVATARLDSSDTRLLLWSDDGLTWTEVGEVWGFGALAASPRGFALAGGRDSTYYMAVSADGRVWEQVAPGGPADDVDIEHLVWIGDRYLALGTSRRTRIAPRHRWR